MSMWSTQILLLGANTPLSAVENGAVHQRPYKDMLFYATQATPLCDVKSRSSQSAAVSQ